MEMNEFRLGNLVRDQQGNVMKVIEITKESTIFYLLDRTKFPLPKGWQACPIELSKNIFSNIKGFQILKENSAGLQYAFLENNVFNLDLQITHFTSGNMKGKFFRNGKEIKYLHKLQNLYFELMDSTELEFIKPFTIVN